MKQRMLALAVTGALNGIVHAETALEEMTIVGDREAVQALAGSGALVDHEQIEIEAANDINQLLKTVPGVYIQEEDGYGLRPNIGIRGATSERASKVTLLEDGVLIAPAPYSNPAAYYFPTALRMYAVEVLKGAPLLRYGPQTTGGVINMVSTPIPDHNSGNLDLRWGENGEADLLANYGVRAGAFGVLLETAQRRSEGYKDIDRSSHDTGFHIQDYVAKLAWEGEQQSLLFKLQYSKEHSNETYLGLTDRDFDRDATRRYGLSRIDNMHNDHHGYNVVYRRAITDGIEMSVTGYYNKFSRDWFKLGGGSALINAANAGDAEAQGILDGTVDATGLHYKHNNRDYTSRGVELNFDLDLDRHQVAIGGRVHKDDMDRYQPEEVFDQINGELVYVTSEDATGSDNRKEKADANSFWLVDSWQLSSALDLNLALRYEDVESHRRQFATADRSDDPSRRHNDSDEWLPGASFTYQVADAWQLLAGVHRGFSPLGGGAVASEDPETSVNWEAGFRYNSGLFVEVVGFYSDFKNKTENCSNASPCSNGASSGSFNTGKAVIQGVEVQAGADLEWSDFNIPLSLMYTYTDAAISDDNPSEGFDDGDKLASVPENTFSLRLGLETAIGWNNYVVAKYTDEMCMRVGCNKGGTRYDRSEDLFVLDFISRYAVTERAVAYVKVENVFDEEAIVSRQPDGARPNKPRTASVGVEWSF